MVPQIPSPPPMTFEGSGPSPPRCPGQREGAAAGRQVLSVRVAGSVAETPRLIEGTELGLEYAPFDEDDGPVDCDCPASCYRGHRGDRSAPTVAGNGGWDGGRPSPVTSALTTPLPPALPHPVPLLTQDQALVQQFPVAPSQEEEEKERRPPEKPVRAAPPGWRRWEGCSGAPRCPSLGGQSSDTQHCGPCPSLSPLPSPGPFPH